MLHRDGAFRMELCLYMFIISHLKSRAADENCYVIMASLDLSMAFDLVNIKLLLKRLRVMGFPSDLVTLIGEWLSGRKFYVIKHELANCAKSFMT